VIGVAVRTRNFLPISGKFLVTEAICDGIPVECIFSRGVMLVAWPFRGESNSHHAVPIAVTYCVLGAELGINLVLMCTV
jgi:hypothetical protein